MLPLIALAGVIGAVMSVAKGAAWASDQVDSTKGAASVGGKGGTGTQIDAKSAPFADALAAQVAGQSMPASPAVTPMPINMPPPSGTDYDALARMKAGFAAYNHIGAHHGDHPKPADESDRSAIGQS
jgi:hypothetical protein